MTQFNLLSHAAIMHKILVAPSGFKESLSAPEVADAIESGLRSVWPMSEIVKMPIPDGGEGFTLAMVEATHGSLEYFSVSGPLNEQTIAPLGFLGNTDIPTAVIEMASAAGLTLIPTGHRNPLVTTTYGVGELIKIALDHGAKHILIGCGDSGTNDAGAGMICALGAKLFDSAGAEVPRGALGLSSLAKIDLANLDPRLKTVTIEAACNITNVLCGVNGVARVYGPQKGADEKALIVMERGLDRFAKLAQKYVAQNAAGVTPDLATMPGGGASGGLGAAVVAILNGKLSSRFAVVFKYIPFEEALNGCDLVITAEGAIDFQTPRGKVPAEVAKMAKNKLIPCIGLAGTLGTNYKLSNDIGLSAIFSILDKPRTLESSIKDAKQLVSDSIVQIAKLMDLSLSIAQNAMQKDHRGK